MPSPIAVVANEVNTKKVGFYTCPHPGCPYSTDDPKRLGKNEHPMVHEPPVECSICKKAIQPKKSNVIRHLHEQHGFFHNTDPFAGFEKRGKPGLAVKTDACASFLTCTTEDAWKQSMYDAVLNGANPATKAVYATQTQEWRVTVASRIAEVT